ncbi:CRISPR-associated protein Cas4 [Halobellus sp. GM3]|uniref:CRISPR-associated protein Cas4 n=1 Tax=Halobellus sp. GM3 TaxID=3458410 RepID=UPI00403DD942
MSPPTDSIPISHLARAAYCPRQLYYARREDDFEPPPAVGAVRELADEYEANRSAPDRSLRERPIAVSPATYRSNLSALARRDDYDRLAAPSERDVFLRGRDCHGVAHKVLCADGDARDASPPTPTFVSPGDPPPRGVWEPQRVRAVAVAKALAWERERAVPRALVEYPAHGIVRTVRLTTRNRSAYRRALWTVRSMGGVPSRIRDESKCDACEYRTRCGTKTRSLKTMLGFG